MIFKQFKIYTFYFYFLLFNLLDDLVGFLISVILISIFSISSFVFFFEMRVAGGGRSAVGIKTGEEDSRTESSSVTGSGAGLGDLDLF